MRLRVVFASFLLAASVAGGGSERTQGVGTDALRIDLGDPDPAGLDLLPGISEDEVAALAAVAGPGSTDLEERLSETGLPPERLREWAPYLILSGSADFAERWVFHSSVQGDGGRLRDSRMRVAFRAGRVQGSWGIRGMPERTDPAASVVVATDACNVTAGAIACGVAGGNPWNDPIAIRGSRSTTISAAALRPNEKSGSRGIALHRPGTGGISAWRDPTDGGGLAFAVGRSEGVGIIGGGTMRGVEGLGVRFPVGEATLRSAIRLAKGIPPSLVVDAVSTGRSRGRLRVAWSLGPRSDGLQGRVEGVALGRVRSFRWTAAGAVLGPGRPGRSSILGDFDVERVGRSGAQSMSLAWSARPSSRLAFGHPFPVPGGGFVHLDGDIDVVRLRHRRIMLRLAFVRGIVQIQGSGPIFGDSRDMERDRWKWTVSCQQSGEK